MEFACHVLGVCEVCKEAKLLPLRVREEQLLRFKADSVTSTGYGRGLDCGKHLLRATSRRYAPHLWVGWSIHVI
jgi:hypothetical protein